MGAGDSVSDFKPTDRLFLWPFFSDAPAVNARSQTYFAAAPAGTNATRSLAFATSSTDRKTSLAIRVNLS
jgi:hypothetical protein